MMEFQLNIGGAKPLVFKDEAALLAWCEKELEAWAWVRNSNIPSLREFHRPVRDLQHGIASGNYSTDSHKQQQLANLCQQLQNQIDAKGYIYSKSVLAKFVLQEQQSNPRRGLVLLHIITITKREPLPNQIEYHLAVSVLSNFERGISKSAATASLAAIEETRAGLEALIQQESNESQARLQRLNELVEARELDAEGWKDTLGAATKTLLDHTKIVEKQLDSLFETAKLTAEMERLQLITKTTEEIEDFKKVLIKEIALKEPIDYWTQKATDHEKAKNRWGRLLTIYVLTVVILLATFVLGFDDGIQGFIASWKDSGIGAVATFAGLIGIGMVIARVFYRLFASQLHLWNDARERVTMIQTYLALEAEGHVKEEFLGALLQRLFSPSSDGIVKSDLGAVGPTDALLKLLGNK